MIKEYNRKKRILVWIVIVLIVINLTALGTFAFQKYDRHRNYQKELNKSEGQKFNRSERIKLYVKKELNLTDDQCSVYFHSLDKNFVNTKLISEKISESKRGIINEVLTNNPDTTKVNQLCDSLGYFNKQLQFEMNRHLRDVNKCLDSTQRVKLKEILFRMNDRDWKKGENSDRQHEGRNWNN